MIITVDTTLEQMLDYTGSLKCQRGLDCCRRPEILLEDDIRQLSSYFWKRRGLAPGEVANKYLDSVNMYGERFYTPKMIGSMCIFLGFAEKADIEEKGPLKRMIDRIADIRNNSCRLALPSNIVTYCMIEEAKPLLGRLMNCVQSEKTDLWFTYKMIASRSQKSLDMFMKEYRRSKYFKLPGLC